MADQEVELSPDKKAALARFKGETITPTEEKTAEQIAADKAEADKILADKAEADRLQAEIDAKKNTPAVVEISDEQLLEAIAKKSGRKITSWDELKPTPEVVDKEKEAEKRESEKLTFGLKKGLFNKKQYEGFISDSKNPIGLVFAAELNEAKKDDPDWNEDKEKEFKEEFDAKFGLDLDPTSSKHKRGQKQINIIAETILRHSYSPIFNLEGEYSRFESENSKQKEIQDKIIAAAPVYKQDVTDSVSKLSKIDIAFGDETYEVPVSKEILDSIQETLMDKDFVSSKITQGYTKDEIYDIAHNLVISQNFASLSYEAAKQYRAKHEKGVRGIPQGGNLEKGSDPHEGLTEDQKKAIKFYQPAGSNAN
jgi:hypothetical protein